MWKEMGTDELIEIIEGIGSPSTNGHWDAWKY